MYDDWPQCFHRACCSPSLFLWPKWFDSRKQKHTRGSDICKSMNCSNPIDMCALQRHLNELKMKILARLHCNWCKYMEKYIKKKKMCLFHLAFGVQADNVKLYWFNPSAWCVMWRNIFWASEMEGWRLNECTDTCRHPAAHSRLEKIQPVLLEWWRITSSSKRPPNARNLHTRLQLWTGVDGVNMAAGKKKQTTRYVLRPRLSNPCERHGLMCLRRIVYV